MKIHKTSSDTADETKKEEALKGEIDQWKEKYLRALADYHNLVKRTEGEMKETRLYAAQGIIEKLLPVIDNLERAQVHISDKGLEITLKELFTILFSVGVEKMNVIGKAFDPHTMECVEVVEGEEDKVIKEIVSGYVLHGKVIRPSYVQVGKNTDTKENNTTEEVHV